MTTAKFPLRPFLPSDTPNLRELFAAAIEELTQEDYDEDQRAAWAAAAEDAAEFGRRLGAGTTLLVEVAGKPLGFATLKDNKMIEMLYVHPHFAGEGVGSALIDALERLAAARGSAHVEADVSDTAVEFFEGRGYVAQSRNSVPRGDQWLATTTMKKMLCEPASGAKA